MCKNCETKPVYEFTNKRKLCFNDVNQTKMATGVMRSQPLKKARHASKSKTPRLDTLQNIRNIIILSSGDIRANTTSSNENNRAHVVTSCASMDCNSGPVITIACVRFRLICLNNSNSNTTR